MFGKHPISLLERHTETDILEGEFTTYSEIGKANVTLKIRIPAETAGLKNREGLDAREGSMMSRFRINAEYIYSPTYDMKFQILEQNFNAKRFLYHIREVKQ